MTPAHNRIIPMKSIGKKQPLVSVVIPTKNSAGSIEHVLQSIGKQTYAPIEVVIVDNHSTDTTVQVAKRYTSRVFIHGPERAAQVNYGVAKAKGKYVYYTGSDMTIEPDLVRQAVEACEKRDADAVYLNVLTKIKNPTIWQRVRAVERECYFMEPGMSGARFWKKQVFLSLGGFDTVLGDEIEFQSRLNEAGYKTVFIKAKENNLGEYANYRTIVTRSIYYGWLMQKAVRLRPERMKKQYKPVRSEFWHHRDILLRDKRVFAYFILYKLTQYICAGFGYTLSLLMGYNTHIEKLLHKMNYGK